MEEILLYLNRLVEKERKSLRSRVHLNQAIESLQTYKKLKEDPL